ncbi:hypothetical protein EGK14_00395 [Erwinia sp. 198]|nr:hypothetical protein EGK14_00395 [Erwinia sp. 198]
MTHRELWGKIRIKMQNRQAQGFLRVRFLSFVNQWQAPQNAFSALTCQDDENFAQDQLTRY